FSYSGSDLRTYLPGTTACSLRTGLVTPSTSLAVTSTGTPGFGETGSWQTLRIAACSPGSAGAAPAAGGRAGAMARPDRPGQAVPIVRPSPRQSFYPCADDRGVNPHVISERTSYLHV